MFKDNQPNGETEIFFANGEHYVGEVIRGVMTGKGFLEKLNNQSFKGEFKDGLLHGEGQFFIKDGSYQLDSKWTDGVPEYQSNKVLFEVLSPVEEEEDPKVKKDPKKAAAAPVEEGEGTGNEIKISVDLANANEEQRKLTF